ncbi:hypothetical protein CTAYLR_004022 [Chrysophaeum taylorii]|uniref:Thiaminase-2/PQQC domain-containing protein n=1 Tax=Chrysophaeum taylorii TaxID=2483200 RepID=A0AAD7XFY2_9STRA|nr:hypothetical protein CTAYLR_004022 [Chrysophaeum taylorii]
MFAVLFVVVVVVDGVQLQSPFARKALSIVAAHRIVKSNPYCEWFRHGEANRAQVRDLVQQFSVFSNLFLSAQLRKVLNAPSLEEMREGKEILANEIGVAFNKGSIEGGKYSHESAHFEWLLDVGDSVGLTFDQMGKRCHGSPETLHFCDALYDIYGSDDLNEALGASFAIEHWANAGFWDSLVEGMERLDLPLGFWRFHQALEAQHAAHTMDELEASLAHGLITNQATFEDAANRMLDACAVFWDGLEAKRHLVLSSK